MNTHRRVRELRAARTVRSDVITPALAAPPISIERLTDDDLHATAAIHRLAFPGAAISQLGLPVAARYHASLLARDDIVAWTAFERSRVVGFCFGGTARDVEGAFLRDNLSFIAAQIAARPLLLTQPFMRQRIAAGLRFLLPWRPRSAAAPAAVADATVASRPRSFTILYLAVHPAFQRRGVARRLLEESEAHARAAGFAQLDLSVYLDNIRAIEFYEHAGWQRLVQDGEWQGFMFKPLN